MARIADFSELEITQEQSRVADAILHGPRRVIEGPLRIWLHRPELAQKAQELGAYCRYGTSLPARLSELAILVTGAYWKAGFEWHVHALIAERSGISLEAIECIRRGEEPALSGLSEQAVYAFCRELLVHRKVSSATFGRAVEQLGEGGAVDLVGILGYYALISMTIVAFDVDMPGRAAQPF